MDVTFLGTGTSMGVPMIGCTCAVCLSTDPRDNALAAVDPGALTSGATILVDTSSDLRAQALRFKLTRIDAVLYTHSHADHILGLDELRRFNTLQKGPIPLYGDDRTMTDLRRIFGYAFQPVREPGHEYVPQLVPFVLDGPFCVAGAEVRPVPVTHGARTILGFRFGRFAYLTDCCAIPDASWPLLEDLDVVVLDALRERPHTVAFLPRPGCRRRAADRRRPHLLHPHGARPGPRRHLRAPARGDGAGPRRPDARDRGRRRPWVT